MCLRARFLFYQNHLTGHQLLKKVAKIRVKNRDPIPIYTEMDERRIDRDSDLGDDSPMVSFHIIIIITISFSFSLHYFIRVSLFISTFIELCGNKRYTKADEVRKKIQLTLDWIESIKKEQFLLY